MFIQLLDRKADPLKLVSYGLHVSNAFTMQSFLKVLLRRAASTGHVRDSNGALCNLRVAEDFSMISVTAET